MNNRIIGNIKEDRERVNIDGQSEADLFAGVPELTYETTDLDSMKDEAVYYMHLLGIDRKRIGRFVTDNVVPVYDAIRGEFLDIDVMSELERKIRKFTRYSPPECTYFVLRHVYAGYRMDSLLEVSPYPADWQIIRRGVSLGIVPTLTFNHDVPDFSDPGNIYIEKTNNGGLVRIA